MVSRNTFLIPGHIGLAEYEVTLGIALGAFGITRNPPEPAWIVASPI